MKLCKTYFLKHLNLIKTSAAFFSYIFEDVIFGIACPIICNKEGIGELEYCLQTRERWSGVY